MKKFLMLALFCTSAHAEFWTGNKLYERLSSSDQTTRISAMSYVLGVHDATERVTHCSPDTVTAGQINDLVLNFLILSPDLRHAPANSIVSGVLKATFPCKGRNGTNL